MAVTTIESKDLRYRISVDSGTTYKKLVCKQAFDMDSKKNITVEESDCGQHVSVGSATDTTFNFEFILNLTPAIGEISAADVAAAHDAGTLVYIKVDDADSGATYYRSASGYLESYKESAPLNGLVKGSGTFRVNGSVDFTA